MDASGSFASNLDSALDSWEDGYRMFLCIKALVTLCGCYTHGFSRIKEQVGASFPLGWRRMSSFMASLVYDSILLKR